MIHGPVPVRAPEIGDHCSIADTLRIYTVIERTFNNPDNSVIRMVSGLDRSGLTTLHCTYYLKAKQFFKVMFKV